MRYLLFCTLLLIMGIHHRLYAQQQTGVFDLADFIESFFNVQEENLNYEELYERLLLLYEEPIDLNRANPEILRSTHLLSLRQIMALLEYIKQNGPLLSLYEVPYIPGFDANTVEKLLPFVTINPLGLSDNRSLIQRIKEESNNYFILRYNRVLEQRRGYSIADNSNTSRYKGDPNTVYLRYRISRPGDFSIGFTLEKDAGEAAVWAPSSRRYLADFWSGHILLENKGKWKKIVIGDYQLQFGQGLVYGAGFNVGKGAFTVNTAQKAELGIRPYTSVLESGFLRGVAATYQVNKKWRATFFGSRLRQDAHIKTSNRVPFPYFSAFQRSGYHRTDSEVRNKHQIVESNYGVNLSYKPSRLTRLGMVGTISELSKPLVRKKSPYNIFNFSGSYNYNLSFYGNTSWRQFSLFGEVATSKSGGLGSIVGLTTSLSPRIDFALLWRRYERDFHTFYSTAFAESSGNVNEYGIYWGIKYKLNKKFFLTAYYDSFRFPWLKFRIARPSVGSDFFFRANYQPSRHLALYFQYRKKIKAENISGGTHKLIKTAPGQRNQFLLHMNLSVNEHLKLSSRIQYSNFYLGNTLTDGLAVVQDARYTWGNFEISGRMALFDTEGAKNRQYVYERDVLYAFSIPAYSGRGIRNYLLVSFKASRKISLWARIARTTYYDRNQVGSGLELIEGNHKTDIKLQLRYRIR